MSGVFAIHIYVCIFLNCYTIHIYACVQIDPSLYHCCPHVTLAECRQAGFVRCECRTCIQPYAHLEPKVKVTAEGVVHRLGVKARCRIKKGTVICMYSGMTLEDVLFVNNRSAYIVEVDWWHGSGWETWYLDAKHLNACAGRYINGIRGTGKTPNAEHVGPLMKHPVHQCWYVRCVALRDIELGEEILVDYGDDYWDNVIPVNDYVRDPKLINTYLRTLR